MERARDLIGVIDRLEADRVILDLDRYGPVELPAAVLPTGSREGDVLHLRLERSEYEVELAELQARDLGESVPFIRRLEGALRAPDNADREKQRLSIDFAFDDTRALAS